MEFKKSSLFQAFIIASFLLLTLLLQIAIPQENANQMLKKYNPLWRSQSKDSSGSMPVGGHDIGLNVWVEKNELLFYMMQSGCFSENNEFLKHGRVRLKLSPNPFSDSSEFQQQLKLQQGYAEIISKDKDELSAKIRVWVEVHRPVIHVDIETSKPTLLEAAYEGWRNEDLLLPDDGKKSRFGCFGYDGYPNDVYTYKDKIENTDDKIIWYHRNQNDKLIFDIAVKHQGLEAVKDKMWNPLKDLTFGGMITGKNMEFSGTGNGTYIITEFKSWQLKSKEPAKKHEIKIFLHIQQAERLEKWKKSLNRLSAAVSPSSEEAWKKNLDWWKEFWNRSYLIINGANPNEEDLPWQIARNYQLFRYQLGCNAYGSYPTKFNGGLFTYDPSLVKKRRKYTPDWRAWGGGSFTSQNQRLVYWPMLKSGDFKMMKPQFEYYRRALGNAVLRVKTYWGHEGCLFTEQVSQFGLPIASHWGWTNQKEKKKWFHPRFRPIDHELGVQVNSSCKYHYEAQLEFSYMILEYHRFTKADISAYIPFIKESVKFFDEHYKMRNKKKTGKELEKNKLVFYPAAGLETLKQALNPTDLIAGLQACLTSLLELDSKYVSSLEKKYYKNFFSRLPDYGYTVKRGDRIIKPAWSWKKSGKKEIPELYTLFPFNRFYLGKHEMDLFRNTWKHGKFQKGEVKSWHQDGIFLARMGMTKEAAKYNIKKMENSKTRFPAFWGPGHDWAPDHNWGGSGMIGLQEMLMQTCGDQIILLPAWPKDWDTDFKLHAPENTIVEGKVRSGKVVYLKVTPEKRRKDVVIME